MKEAKKVENKTTATAGGDARRGNIEALHGQREKLAALSQELSGIKAKLNALYGNLKEKKSELFSIEEEKQRQEEAKIALEQKEKAKTAAAAKADSADVDVSAPSVSAPEAAQQPVESVSAQVEVKEEAKTAIKSDAKAEAKDEAKPEIAVVAPEAEVKKAESEEKAAKEAAPSTPAAPAEPEIPPRRVWIPPEPTPAKDKKPHGQGNRVYIPSDSPRQRPQGNYPSQNTGGYTGSAPSYGGNRPQTGGRPQTGQFAPPPPPSPLKDARGGQKKKTGPVDDKKSINKRALIKKGFIVDNFSASSIEEDGETRVRTRKFSKKNEFIQPVNTKIEAAIVTTEIIPIKVLSEKIGKTGAEIIKKLFFLGIIKTINESIDFDTAELVASEFGVALEYKPEKTFEDTLTETESVEEDDSVLVSRPPVVTIMGHVDHGKTSLLDYIRKANVASGEAGGITQHIGAYTVALGENMITFLDTPGHEAFTAMRARGAQITDVAVLVVAADDGIMPQTIEAINHAKQAGVQIIIAINKMDKTGANPERIMQQLTEHEILPEEWGGDVPVVKVSAKTGDGVQNLLENILLVAEMKELKANPDKPAKGVIIEAKLDKGRGPLATVLVQTGTLRVGDFLVAGTVIGKIRTMIDDKGRTIKEAGPSMPASVVGFSEVPNAGDAISVVTDDRFAKQLAEERALKEKAAAEQAGTPFSLDDAFSKIKSGQIKDLNIIIKADVQGSVEAVRQSLVKLSNEEVKINVIHGGVGAINESDVMLAGTAGAIIIGFNVRPDANAKSVAEKKHIDIRLYRVIYDAIDDVESAIKGMLAPKFREVVLGTAEVRQVFRITGTGSVAGSYVTDGKIVRNAKIRLLRDNVVIYEGEIGSLKRIKDDVKEVARGYECGISIANYNDIKEGDVMEAFMLEQIEV